MPTVTKPSIIKANRWEELKRQLVIAGVDGKKIENAFLLTQAAMGPKKNPTRIVKKVAEFLKTAQTGSSIEIVRNSSNLITIKYWDQDRKFTSKEEYTPSNWFNTRKSQ